MKEPYGVLMFPGFGENADCLSAVEVHMKEQGLPSRVPALRGHGAASPDALRGVTWHDWMADGDAALRSILGECDKAILIGHSMGGLVALLLAADHPDVIDSLVLAAPAIQLASPWAPGHALNAMLPVLPHLVSRQPTPAAFTDPALAHDGLLYPWAPADAFAQALALSKVARRRLAEVSVPTLILQSRADTVVAPLSAEIVYNSITTSALDKRIVWFEKTNHIMFCDCEAEAVIAAIVGYVRERIGITPDEANARRELLNALWPSK